MRRWRPSAVRNAAERAGLGPNDVELLTAATTLPDVMGPGHASMVHGELGYGPLEIATAHGICSSGMMALKNAYLQVAIGEKRNAICVASEFASRGFKSTRYDEMRAISEDGSLPMETAFLRYMLSDGAGAAVVESAPATSGISLRIDWISLTSYANTEKACMYFGSNDNACAKTWGDYPTAAAAAADGALAPRQKLSLLPHLVRVGIDEYERLLAMGKFDPTTVTWFPVHYSSERMKTMVLGELSRRNVASGRPEMWYSNLTRVGNIGSAAIFVILDEMMTDGLIKDGDTLLCMVPESGRFVDLVHASHRGVGGCGVGNPAMTPVVRAVGDRAASPSGGRVPLFADRTAARGRRCIDRSAGRPRVGHPLGGRPTARRVSVSVADSAILWGVPRGGGSGGARGARRAGGRLRHGARRIGDPGLPGVVPGAVASHPVAAESASRGGPEPEGRLADRVPQHVVLGGDRGVRAAAVRGCSARRRGRGDRHTAAVDDARDHPALAADRQARTLPVVRAGRGRRRGTRSGRRCGCDASPSPGSVRKSRRPSCPPWLRRIFLPARCFVGGARRSGRLGDSARWRRPRPWQRSCSAWESASWWVCR